MDSSPPLDTKSSATKAPTPFTINQSICQRFAGVDFTRNQSGYLAHHKYIIEIEILNAHSACFEICARTIVQTQVWRIQARYSSQIADRHGTACDC